MQDDVRPSAKLGALVEERRRAAGLTQRELAQRSGVSVGAIRDLEQGRTSWPRRDAADSLARVLGLRYQNLTGQQQGGQRNEAPGGNAPLPGSEPAGDVRVAVLGPLAAWRGKVGVDQARMSCREALALHRELGACHGEATTLDSLGYAEHHLGHLTEAAACYEHALSLLRELGDHYLEAVTLIHLGETRQAAGDRQQARDAWQEALAILEDLDHPDAEQVRARLSG